ncbi:luciferin sulfotransferase-like [Cloeon dipterum]|uniref:luciferin sulfotransferase-like n=1 Tax=Cloeon dipterum TaxID=197152 RepID=UPI00321F8C16
MDEELQFEPTKIEHYGHFYSNGFIRSVPDSCLLSSIFPQVAKEISDFEVHPNDTWVITFPKCGTTWTQEMVWLLQNNLDFDRAKEISLSDRFPFLEATSMAPDFSKFLSGQEVAVNASIENIKNSPQPRFIKTHLHKRFLPKQLWTVKPKIFYVVREVKDVIVSYYHHKRFFYGYTADLETFARSFMKDEIIFCPFWSHVTDFWKIKDEPNILFLSYEEMLQDLAAVVRKVAAFLDKSLTAEQVDKLCHHLNFKQMKSNKSVNFEGVGEVLRTKNISSDDNCRFFREGKSGSGKEQMSEELVKEVDEWSRKKLESSDFKMYF